MPRLDTATIPEVTGSPIPAQFAEPFKRRFQKRLGEAAGLTQVGVNLVRLSPHAWSSQRHWHSHDDEFVYVLEGEVVLLTNRGAETVRAGDCAAFKAGVPDGHCFQNRSERDVVLLVVGSRNDEDQGEYPDIDLRLTAGRYSGKGRYLHKDGRPYEVG